MFFGLEAHSSVSMNDRQDQEFALSSAGHRGPMMDHSASERGSDLVRRVGCTFTFRALGNASVVGSSPRARAAASTAGLFDGV